MQSAKADGVGGQLGDGDVLPGPRGRYRIEAVHGGGAAGVTYRAVRVEDGRAVIVKTLRLAGLPGWKALELFEREAAVLRALSHPGIPAWIDDVMLGDPAAPAGFALVMELVPGPTLRQAIRGGGLGRDQMRAWLRDLLSVLAFIHGRAPPLIHRDVNPKNIVLRPDGPAALVDFGSVQAALRNPDEGAPTSTGTFGYAPMEQFMGQASPASDLYGAGMSYLAAAAGREPDKMPLRGIAVDVPRLLPDEDPRLLRLLQALTEPDPRARLSSAAEALTLLTAVAPTALTAAAAPLTAVAAAALTPTALTPPTASPPARTPRARAGRTRITRTAPAPRPGNAYLDRLARALTASGFSLEPGGQLARTPLAFIATRPAHGLADEAICIYATSAAALDGATPDKLLAPVPAGLFVQAAADHHPPSEGLLRRLLDDRPIVVPLIAGTAGIASRTRGHLAETLREPRHLTVITALVDAGVVDLIIPRSLLAGDPDDRVGRVRRALAITDP